MCGSAPPTDAPLCPPLMGLTPTYGSECDLWHCPPPLTPLSAPHLWGRRVSSPQQQPPPAEAAGARQPAVRLQRRRGSGGIYGAGGAFMGQGRGHLWGGEGSGGIYGVGGDLWGWVRAYIGLGGGSMGRRGIYGVGGGIYGAGESTCGVGGVYGAGRGPGGTCGAGEGGGVPPHTFPSHTPPHSAP